MRVYIFTFILVCSFVASKAVAHPAWAIAVDDQNRIYLSDLEKIWKIDERGAVSVFAERHTHEITLDADNNLLGEELLYEPSTQKFSAALWKIKPNGEFAYLLAPTETPPKGVSIWRNAAGASFYFGQTDGAAKEFYLLKRNAAGDVSVLYGDRRKALAHRQVVPYSFAGMTFAADGSLYFKNADTIWKAAPNDQISIVADRRQLSAVAPDPMLFGVAVDAQQNVYTTDYNGKKVLRIATDKKISVVFQSDKDWSPVGIYAKNKNLYVLESKNAPPNPNPIVRVQKIEANGKISISAIIGENRSVAPAAKFDKPMSLKSGAQSEPSGRFCPAVILFFAAACLVFRKEIVATIKSKR